MTRQFASSPQSRASVISILLIPRRPSHLDKQARLTRGLGDNRASFCRELDSEAELQFIWTSILLQRSEHQPHTVANFQQVVDQIPGYFFDFSQGTARL